jgi:sporadic carbohydrate cluster 2OG-Fe(II) oxygenase
VLSWENPSDIAREFVSNGMVTIPVPDRALLESLRGRVADFFRAREGGPGEDEACLNRLHERVSPETLNGLRMTLHRELGAEERFREAAFRCARPYLHDLVGNELVMQRQVNFVIQMPNDGTSLFPIHTDAWSGCSPYEVVLWIPLVEVQGTKSMLICRKERSLQHLRALGPDFLEKVRPDLEPVRMKFGQALLFSTTLIHGADLNQSQETRVILNVRFKSLFSPYGTKTLGETFVPVRYLPVTEVGLDYEAEFGL